MRYKPPIVAVAVCVTAMLSATSSFAQDAGRATRVRSALERMEGEPTIIEVHREALRYFRVHPEAVERIRRVAVRRSAAPTMSITGRYEYINSQRDVYQQPTQATTDDDFGSNVAGGSVTLSWNFPGLVFNPAELQTYALIGIQMNVLKEVTRLYYVRRQLLLSLLADPPDDPRTRVAMRMRVEEFTSLIDSFTGGWFSRNLPDADD